MKHAYGILTVLLLVAVIAGAAEEESDSVVLSIEQLALVGSKYFRGPGVNATTAKKEEIIAGLRNKKVSFAATVRDIIRSKGSNASFVMALVDTSQTLRILAHASTGDEKVLNIGVGDRVSVVGRLNDISFGASDGKPFIEIWASESEVTVLTSGSVDRALKHSKKGVNK